MSLCFLLAVDVSSIAEDELYGSDCKTRLSFVMLLSTVDILYMSTELN